jgi:hypothetical protein
MSWRFFHEAPNFRRQRFFDYSILTSACQFTVGPENVLVGRSAPLVFPKQYFPEFL